MATSQPHKPQSAALRMADGGSFTQMFREKVFGAPKGYTPAAKVAAPAPAQAPAQPPAKAITDYSSGSATQRRMTELGLKDGGDLRTGQGGNVPGTGKGDKVPAKYEPGEFVVSNAMLEADPELRAELQSLRARVLAAQGKTVEQADAAAMGGEEFQAVDGGEREKRTAFPTNIPARSPYATQGNPVREFGDAASRMTTPTMPRAADGSLAGPGVTPYAPYRMAGFNRPAPQPAPVARPAGAAMAAPTPIPAVGTMPPEQEVQGTNVNPLARAAGAVGDSLAAAFPAARQAYSDANAATLDAAQRGDYAAAAGQAVRGAVVAPVMAAGDVIGGVAGTLASVAKPVAQFGYTAVTGDSTPIFQGDPRSTTADTPASKNPAADQGQTGATIAPGARPAGSGTRTATDPRRTDVDPTDPRFGAARDVSRELASVPKDLPADLREGVVFKTKDENGRTVYSGRNVGAAAQMVDGMGRQTASRGTVSTVPGMAQSEIAATLARPLDPRTAMTAAQRFQYDKEVQNAQGVNNFNAGINSRGTTIGDLLRSGNERRALANENARGEIASRQQQDQSRSAADVLAQRRQDESESNSGVTRRTGEVALQGAEQIQTLRNQLLEAETPEERNSVAKKLQALTGKETQNRYTVIPGGQEFDQAANAVITRPAMVLDNSSGRLVDVRGQGGDQPLNGDAGTTGIQPPPDAITFLREKGADDPAVVQMFDAKYGKGAAARYLK